MHFITRDRLSFYFATHGIAKFLRSSFSSIRFIHFHLGRLILGFIHTISIMNSRSYTTSPNTAYNPVSSPHQKRRRITVSGPCTAPPLQMERPVRRSSLPILKQVQFSESSEVCVLDHQQTTTVEDWYTVDDQSTFKRERMVDLVSLRSQSNRRPSCPVGLEQFLSSKNRQETKENRKLVIHVVLEEQKRQKELGVVETDRLALLAMNNTSQELAKAVKRGKFQEMAKFMD